MKIVLITMSMVMLAICCFSQDNFEILDPGTDDGIHDIEITPNGTIFIYTYGTGKVLKSTDEGASWNLMASLDSIYFEQIQFINDQEAWICGEYGKIYNTTDGGKSWHDLSIKIDSGNLLLYGMYFDHDRHGMVSGAILNNRKLINKIYQSMDGGKSWKEMTEIKLPSMILNLEKSPSGQLWGSGNNAIVKYEHNTWNTVFYDSTRSTGQIRDLLFLDKQTIFGISFNGKVLKSSDGGKTWEIITVTANRLRSIAALSRQKILIAGDQNKEKGHIFISDDAGISWKVLEKETDDIHRLAISGSSCWLVGKNGTILKYHPTNH